MYSEPGQTSKKERLAKTVSRNYFCEKHSILDVWQASGLTFSECCAE